jgi:cytochrome c553
MEDQDLQDIAAYYNSQAIQLSGAREMQVQLNSGIMVDSLPLGERVWRSGNLNTGVPACTGCHTPSGLGNDPAGFPRLSGQYAEYIEKQLRDFRAGNRINDGDSMMMRLVAERMSDAEIKAVANFISGLH